MILGQGLRYFCAVALLGAICVTNVGAQAAQTSTVNVRVTNAQNAAVTNADVSLVPITPPMQNMPAGMKMTPPTPIAGRATGNGAYTVQAAAGQYILQIDAPGMERSSQEVTLPTSQAFAIKLEPLDIPGAENVPAPTAAQADSQATQERIAALEQRVRDLEAGTVYSIPETRTKKTDVYIDKNNNVYDQPTPGAKKTTTYQRERVYRRQTIDEKIEAALEDQAKHSVSDRKSVV